MKFPPLEKYNAIIYLKQSVVPTLDNCNDAMMLQIRKSWELAFLLSAPAGIFPRDSPYTSVTCSQKLAHQAILLWSRI